MNESRLLRIPIEPVQAAVPKANAEVLSRLSHFIQVHNQTQVYLRDTIRGNCLLVMHNLIVKYVRTWNQYLKVCPTGHECEPSIETNNLELAKLSKCSDRTVRECLVKLEEKGFLIKQFRGSNSPFRLWINPLIASFGTAGLDEFAKNYKPLIINNLQTKSPFLPFTNCQTSPDISDLKKLIFINHTTINCVDGVDNFKIVGILLKKGQKNKNRHLGYDETGAQHTVRPFQSLTETLSDDSSQKGQSNQRLQKVPPQMPGTGKDQKKSTGGGAARLNGLANRHKPKPEPATDQTQLKMHVIALVTMFWQYAKLQLFPEKRISNEQERLIKNLIYKNFYYGQPLTTTKQFDKYQDSLIARVDLMHWQLRNNPRAFVAAPMMYFDINFKNGFVFTELQHTKSLTRRKELHLEYELEKAKRSMLNQKAPQSAPDMDFSELYRYWIDRLSRLKSQAVTDAFNSYVAALPVNPVYRSSTNSTQNRA